MPVTIEGNGLITAGGTSTTQGRVRLAEDTDNGSNYIELTAPASVTSNQTITFPDATTTVVGTDTTQTLTNKTLGSGLVAGASLLTSGTAITLTTQTAPEFPSLPSWIKRIVIMFSGVSTNGTSNLLIRLGTSGGIQTSTYTGRTIGGQTTMNGALDWTNGVEIQHGAIVAATDVLGGSIVFNLLNASTNVWAISGGVSRSSSPTSSSFQAGVVTLSSTMTTLRLTTANGTDQFDAGSINILYE